MALGWCSWSLRCKTQCAIFWGHRVSYSPVVKKPKQRGSWSTAVATRSTRASLRPRLLVRSQARFACQLSRLLAR